MGTYEARLETFSTWKHHYLKPESLAEAGLFYTGESDCTLCYACGLGSKKLDSR